MFGNGKASLFGIDALEEEECQYTYYEASSIESYFIELHISKLHSVGKMYNSTNLGTGLLQELEIIGGKNPYWLWASFKPQQKNKT